METWLANTRETFRTELWPIPTIAVVAALPLGLGLPEVDVMVNKHLSGRVSDWLFGGDGDAARSLLDAIASSLISAGLAFALTVVTQPAVGKQPVLPEAAESLHLRPVRAGHPGAVLGDLHLRTPRAPCGAKCWRQRAARVRPEVAVTLAFVLAVASVLGLVLFLAHLTEQYLRGPLSSGTS